jgi:hypothetical protein
LLKNIFHVPSAHKSLASVHHFTSDNNVFLEFHPNFFLIKDKATKKTLHRGKCEGGLYPLVPGATKEKNPEWCLESISRLCIDGIVV